MTTPKHTSHSAVNAFTRCGKAYELRKVLKFPEPPAWYLIAGSAIHTATELWDRGQGASPSELFIEAFQDEIERARADWPDDSQWLAAGYGHAKQTYAHWFTRGQDYLEQWASTSFPGTLVAVELDVSTVLPSGLEVKGFVDRLYRTGKTTYEVWDLKSGSRRPDSDQQLGMYSVLVDLWLNRNAYTRDPVHRGITAANYMFKDGYAHVVDTSAWTLATVDQLAQAWVRGVENRVFLPVRSADCNRCSVADACYLQSGDTPVTRLYDNLNPNKDK